MKLNQEDRTLFYDFFNKKREWIELNSLNNSDNLQTLKDVFSLYIKENEQEDNISFMIFLLTIDQEIIDNKKNLLISKYNGDNKKQFKTRMLYKSETDNDVISSWIMESKIVNELTSKDIANLDSSIHKKVKQNAFERRESFEDMRNKIVK